MVHALLDALTRRLFLHDTPFVLLMSGACAVHFLLWAFVGIGFDTFRPSDTDYITLHYKIIFGTDFIARWESIFLLPVLGAFILVCNGILGRSMMHTHKTLTRAFALTALVAQVLIFLALYLLYHVNR